jgi:hypothetical protein
VKKQLQAPSSLKLTEREKEAEKIASETAFSRTRRNKVTSFGKGMGEKEGQRPTTTQNIGEKVGYFDEYLSERDVLK